MKPTEALAQLKALGTAQNRKVYARHGVTGAAFGVSYGALGKLKKAIRIDHELAVALWSSGNHDARILATMVADPARADRKLLEAWVKELDNYVLTDALSGLAARSPVAKALSKKWTKAKGEWVSSAGWNILTGLLNGSQDVGFEEAELEELLQTIETRIDRAPNRTRYAMNNALISIGVTSPRLHELATAAAERIGRVEVDHGETGCKTPEAVSYMAKMLAHRAKKAPARSMRRKS